MADVNRNPYLESSFKSTCVYLIYIPLNKGVVINTISVTQSKEIPLCFKINIMALLTKYVLRISR